MGSLWESFTRKAADMAKSPQQQAGTLSEIEAVRLAKLESAIEAGVNVMDAVHEAGKALAEIRDRQLYRDSAATFEAYVDQRFRITARRAGQLIAFSGLKTSLEEMGTRVPETLSEKAARPLTGLSVQAAAEALAEAASSPEGVTAASIRKAAGRRKAKSGKAKKALRPVRFKVPGWCVIATPNKKASGDVIEALRAALRQAEAEGADQAREAA